MSTETRTDTQSPALRVADSHDLIRVHGARMNNLKDVGVEIPKRRLTAFTGVSARAGSPIQPSPHAQSSAGKNFLWDTVLSPPEKVIKRSGFSARALFRT